MMEALAAQIEQQRDQQLHSAHSKTSTRSKSAAALARERRQAAEAERLQQSVRDIFRKLVSQLHPDRELDAGERQRKTVLIQQVNVAYAANDLLGLLELQLKVEQIDQAGLNNLSEERIKQYNKILNGQLCELERETAAIEQALAMEMGRHAHGQLTPQLALRCLQGDIAEMKARIDAIVADLEAFTDVNKIKAWLKTYSPSAAPQYDDVYWY
jgi:hypothetical protein